MEITLDQANAFVEQAERKLVRAIRSFEYERDGDTGTSQIIIPRRYHSITDCAGRLLEISTDYSSLKEAHARLMDYKQRMKDPQNVMQMALVELGLLE